MSRCVFGFGFSLVCYVYSCELVCFELHYLLVVCTRDPLLGQRVYVFYFEITSPSRPPRSSIASGSTQFPRPLPSISFN